MNKILSLLGIAIFISACTPHPYVRYKTPDISGKLRLNDLPAPGVELYLSLDAGDSECRRFVQRTRSDEQGNFTLPAVKEQMDYTPLMTHYFDEWVVCADIQGVRRKLYSNNRYGMGSVANNLSLQCSLNNQVSHEICLPIANY